jgi:CHASE2 domain-containing sensor protein
MNAQRHHLPLIAAAILALLFALWAGLLRLGWTLPAFPSLALAHGSLMISGFLGVLISPKVDVCCTAGVRRRE